MTKMTSWQWFTMVAAILAGVKFAALSSGPTAKEIMVVMLVAQRKIVQAQRVLDTATSPSLVEAEKARQLAWVAFHDEPYKEATAAAKKTKEAARKVG
jgi:hypothetical protein